MYCITYFIFYDNALRFNAQRGRLLFHMLFLYFTPMHARAYAQARIMLQTYFCLFCVVQYYDVKLSVIQPGLFPRWKSVHCPQACRGEGEGERERGREGLVVASVAA